MLLSFLGSPYFVTLIIVVGLVMIFALIFHNVAQAWVASRLGDSSPKYSGYLQFDPQHQLEPFGVLFLLIFGFGWPKPIPANSRNYPGRGRKEAWVWYSGPLAYLCIAFIAALVSVLLLRIQQPVLGIAFRWAASFAVLHAVVNLFPVYPLDGAHAALAWGNRDVRQFVGQLQRFGILGFVIIFIVLNYIGVIPGLENFFLSIIDSLVRAILGG
jgi:Zn-dependent protease